MPNLFTYIRVNYGGKRCPQKGTEKRTRWNSSRPHVCTSGCSIVCVKHVLVRYLESATHDGVPRFYVCLHAIPSLSRQFPGVHAIPLHRAATGASKLACIHNFVFRLESTYVYIYIYCITTAQKTLVTFVSLAHFQGVTLYTSQREWTACGEKTKIIRPTIHVYKSKVH